MYSARSLLRPRLSVIYPCTARHLVLFKSPGNATPPRQFSAEAADCPASKTIIFGFKRVSQQTLPKGDVARGGISWQTPDVDASGAHWEGDSLQSIMQHLQILSSPKEQECSHSPGSAGGYTQYPLGATCNPRLAAEGPGTVHKQLLPPEGTLAGPPGPGSSLGGSLGKAKDADRGWFIRSWTAPCK